MGGSLGAKHSLVKGMYLGQCTSNGSAVRLHSLL